MLRHFDPKMLKGLRDVQSSAMQDTCQILTYTEVKDGYRQTIGTYTAGGDIACGFHEVSAQEVQQEGQIALITAKIRLPIDTLVSNLDRIRIVARHGEAAIESADYDIVGDVRRGPSGLQLDLKSITQR